MNNLFAILILTSLIGCDMSATQYNTATPTDPNPETIIETSDIDAKGNIKISLTNFDNSTIPQIEKGSVVEVSGARFVFNSDETISGNASDGTAYIFINGSNGSANWTNATPVWNAEKQGYYHTTLNYRYIAQMEKSGASYTYKEIMINKDEYIPPAYIKTKISAYATYSTAINHIIFDTKNEYNTSLH